MSDIRPFAHADIGEVSRLFLEVLVGSREPPTSSLRDCLANLFLDGPFADPELPSRVFVNADGAIGGFIGVTVMPLVLGERPLRAAVCGALMVEDRQGNPFAGPRLMKTVLAGPQDLTLSETASEVSMAMWRQLRGQALPAYSLDWIRILSPARYGLDIMSRRLRLARLLQPLADGADRLIRRGSKNARHRWSHVPGGFSQSAALVIEDTDDGTFGAIVRECVASHALHPAWSDDQLGVVTSARHKPDWGNVARRVVRERSGRPIGAFIYHARPGHVARVLQLLATPGREDAVFDCLLADAGRAGATALHGRSQPWLLETLMRRRCMLFNNDWSVVHSRDPEILAAFKHGDAFFNGLAGEHWMPLSGGGYRLKAGSSTTRQG